MGLDINLIREDKGVNFKTHNFKVEILTLLEVLWLRGISKQRQWTILLKWICNGERVININYKIARFTVDQLNKEYGIANKEVAKKKKDSKGQDPCTEEI